MDENNRDTGSSTVAKGYGAIGSVAAAAQVFGLVSSATEGGPPPAQTEPSGAAGEAGSADQASSVSSAQVQAED